MMIYFSLTVLSKISYTHPFIFDSKTNPDCNPTQNAQHSKFIVSRRLRKAKASSVRDVRLPRPLLAIEGIQVLRIVS